MKSDKFVTSTWFLSLLIAVSLIVTVSCKMTVNDPNLSSLDTTNLRIEETKIIAEIAFTSEEKSKGLAGRRSIPDGTGMLFYYSASTPKGFWMKGMLFSIDIIWIGQNCTIIKIENDVTPPSSINDKLKIYPAPALTGAVLELNSGQAALLELNIGDRVVYEPSKMGRSLTCSE